MDFNDLRAKKAPVTKAQLRTRVRNICRIVAARKVASACVAGLCKVCKEVVQKRGAMAKS